MWLNRRPIYFVVPLAIYRNSIGSKVVFLTSWWLIACLKDLWVGYKWIRPTGAVKSCSEIFCFLIEEIGCTSDNHDNEVAERLAVVLCVTYLHNIRWVSNFVVSKCTNNDTRINPIV